MHKVAILNGEIIHLSDARVNAVSSAALYGRGVFTTIAVYDGEPFLIEKHWRRLSDNAARVGIDMPVSFDEINGWLKELLYANSVVDGRARITLFDSSGAAVWSDDPKKRSDVLIVSGDRRDVPDDLRLMVSSFTLNSRSPLAAVKSCNYLEHLMAYEDARHSGFDEAVRTNELGEVASASMSNVFWLRDGQLFTPSLVTGCLAGTTREYILEKLDVSEVRIGIDELLRADSIFISSAGIGIRQVSWLNDHMFQRSVHDVLDLLPPKTKTRMSAK